MARFDLLFRFDLVVFLSRADKLNDSLYTLEYVKSSALDSLERNDQELDN